MSFIKEQQNEARNWFIKEYCVDRNPRIRWIRAIFLDDEDQIHKILESHDRAVSQVVQNTVEEIERKTESLPHYYRSKFSRDCSREETEEEMSTEMLEAGQVQSLLKDITSEDNLK